MRSRIVASIAIALLVAATAAAQTAVVNPRKVIFEPSASHDATDPVSGQPMVLSYKLLITEVGAEAPQTVIDLGKGTPLTAPDPTTPDAKVGEIVAVPALLLSVPVGKRFTAGLVAVGPGGESAVSPAADPFGRVVPPVAVQAKPRLVK